MPLYKHGQTQPSTPLTIPHEPPFEHRGQGVVNGVEGFVGIVDIVDTNVIRDDENAREVAPWYEIAFISK